jgi:hypothetical protein
MDNHNNHINMRFINYYDQNRILLTIFPPHSTHRLQPLDICKNWTLNDRLLGQKVLQWVKSLVGIGSLWKLDWWSNDWLTSWLNWLIDLLSNYWGWANSYTQSDHWGASPFLYHCLKEREASSKWKSFSSPFQWVLLNATNDHALHPSKKQWICIRAYNRWKSNGKHSGKHLMTTTE